MEVRGLAASASAKGSSRNKCYICAR